MLKKLVKKIVMGHKADCKSYLAVYNRGCNCSRLRENLYSFAEAPCCPGASSPSYWIERSDYWAGYYFDA